MAYLDQRAELLRPGASVLDCFRECNAELDLTASRYALARYLFAGDAALVVVSHDAAFLRAVGVERELPL